MRAGSIAVPISSGSAKSGKPRKSSGPYLPTPGGAWTAAKFDGLELGARHEGTSANTLISWTTAMVDYDDGTTAVSLSSFTASGYDGEVLLEWQTASELDNLGFHLHRATSDAGPYERITARAIPGLGSSPVGAKYSYRDTGVINGVTYYYKLEDIETTGKTELHGPVSATPGAGASESPDPPPESSGGEREENASPARITYEDPSASSLRVVRRGRQMILELETGGFYAEPQEDGSVRLTIPEFVEVAEAGAPSTPVRRTWVEALAGRKVKLVSVTARGVETFSGLRPSDAETPEIVASRDGTVRLRQGYGGQVRVAPRQSRTRQLRSRVSPEGGALYPSEPARVVSVGFQGDVKKALVELAPLRWDASTGQLLLARRLVVRLSFREREPAEDVSADGRRGRHYRGRRSHDDDERGVVARLVTTERGLYAVGYEEALGRGRRRTVTASQLRLSRQGKAVAFHLEPDSNRFGSGSILYFVSEGAAANPYGSEAVYELEVGTSGAVMTTSSAAPSGQRTSFYWHRLEREENRFYQAALLNAPDVWLWDLVFAPETKSYPFELTALASISEASYLEVWLQGTSDLPASPDHHVRVYVNGSLVHELSWDGKQARKIRVELPPGVVQEGENHLEIDNAGDTGAAYSMVMLDRFAVTYPRVAMAEGGKLEGSWSSSGMAEVSGLRFGAHAVDVTESDPRWLNGSRVDDNGTLRFRAESGRSYLVVSPDAVLHPEVRKAKASPLKSGRNRADYLVIGPQEFLRAVAPLLELRRRQGLKVRWVAIEDVYTEFGFGESSPQAIREFLSYAYHAWQSPSPRYVVLLGDATYDFKDSLGTGVVNHVPPLMVKTSYLWTASDPTYAAVNGEDLLPDLAIGRLPAASVEELRVLVEKILSYESGAAGLSDSLVLIADNADRAGNFAKDADELASGVLSGHPVRKIYLSELGTSASRAAILDAFDEGASLTSYIGHGGIHLWADERLFDISQVSSLSPQPQQPLLLTMNCLNGYFHFPYFNSLAEELLKAEGKGAIAAFSPSGLSLNGPAHRYHKALLTELFSGKHDRLGDAVMAAQEAYAGTGAFPELLSIYHLLGDPALRLR